MSLTYPPKGFDAGRLQDILCKSMCADVRLHQRPDGRLMVETPFTFGDGDTYSIYLEPLASGGVRITDAGHTLMHMSYSIDLDNIREGRRGRLLERILGESPVTEHDGELLLDSSVEELGRSLFAFGQAVTRVHDLTLWKRQHVAATFYEDLAEALAQIVPAERIHKNYVVPTMPKAADYPVDFFIEPEREQRAPLFLFGIPNRDKARLATIIIQYLTAHDVAFESLLVFLDQTEIARGDLARLSNVGGEMVASLDASDDLRRKVMARVA